MELLCDQFIPATQPVSVERVNNISKKWTMSLRDWKAALTRFTIQFEGRMPND